MLQIKMFRGLTDDVEKEINNWLRDNPDKEILSGRFNQQIFPDSTEILISFLYV